MMVSTVIGVACRRDKTWVHLDLGGFTLLEALESGHTLDYPLADSSRSTSYASTFNGFAKPHIYYLCD